MNVYIASPFFTDCQRKILTDVLIRIKNHFAKSGFDANFFIPMEHFIEDGENLPNHIWGQKVFEMDKRAIDDCDIMIALDFGFSADSGTAWEIGYAFAKGKKVFVINAAEGGVRSLMIVNGCTRYFQNEDDFIRFFFSSIINDNDIAYKKEMIIVK